MNNEQKHLDFGNQVKRLVMQNDLPDLSFVQSDKVTLMKEDVKRFRKSFGALLHFASLILQKDEADVTIMDLKYFAMQRYHEQVAHQKNLSFPVDYYLSRIRKLEKTLAEAGVDVPA